MKREVNAIFQYMRKVDPEFADVIRLVRKFYEDNETVSVIQLSLDINVLELLDIDAQLGNIVLYEPTYASILFQKFVFTAMKALNVIAENTDLSQIHLILKLRDVPALYGQVACYFCPIQGCEGSYGFKYVRIHVPGAAEQTTVGVTFTCAICGETLHEEKTFRRLSDKRILHVTLLDHEDTATSKEISTHIATVRQRLRVICRDEEALEYNIGQELLITGRLVYDTTIPKHSQISVEANVIQTLPLGDVISRSGREVDIDNLPNSISQLYIESVSPAGTFVKLKLSLLLSLLSSGTSKLNLLCVGRETVVTNRLLRYFSSLVDGSIIHSAKSCLFGETREDKQTTAEYFISGGSCLLAHTSVCVIPDVCTVSKVDGSHLLRALEYNKVHLSVQSKSDPVPVDVKCRIWACADDRFITGSASKDTKTAVFPLFDLILITDDLTSDYQDHIANQTLLHALNEGDNSTERVNYHHLQEFLERARCIDITFPEDIKSYLARFYLASRRVRANVSMMPTSSLRTMLTLAESHARLSLRSEVLIEDALAAILLYEECLTSVQHQSVIAVTHEPHWKEGVIDYYLTQQNDDGMMLLKSSVDSFCKLHCGADIAKEE